MFHRRARKGLTGVRRIDTDGVQLRTAAYLCCPRPRHFWAVGPYLACYRGDRHTNGWRCLAHYQ